MTDPPPAVVQVQNRIAAPPVRVFPFLVDPERLTRWMGQPDPWDARPAGLLEIKVDGVHPVRGQFVEVDTVHQSAERRRDCGQPHAEG